MEARTHFWIGFFIYSLVSFCFDNDVVTHNHSLAKEFNMKKKLPQDFLEYALRTAQETIDAHETAVKKTITSTPPLPEKDVKILEALRQDIVKLRNSVIYRYNKLGVSQRKLAASFGLSAGRVCQIVKTEHNLEKGNQNE
jgi:hypothetical protein